MGSRRVEKRPVVKVVDGHVRRRFDSLAAEEPMEIRVGGQAVSVTMRTPGDDFELALGFCCTEGLVDGPDAVAQIRYCEGGPGAYAGEYNVVDLALRDGGTAPADLRRNVYTTSSCGLCGTASIELVRKRLDDVAGDPVHVSPDVLSALPDRLRAEQEVFERTGGLHAAALFTAEGGLVAVKEDVGRHNAVDKLIGWAATQDRLPLTGHILLVSGRVAFEIAQKALWARIPIVAAVSAPSSLAAQLAEDAGMTLVGFLRGSTMNIYAGAHRISEAGDRGSA